MLFLKYMLYRLNNLNYIILIILIINAIINNVCIKHFYHAAYLYLLTDVFCS